MSRVSRSDLGTIDLEGDEKLSLSKIEEEKKEKNWPTVFPGRSTHFLLPALCHPVPQPLHFTMQLYSFSSRYPRRDSDDDGHTLTNNVYIAIAREED